MVAHASRGGNGNKNLSLLPTVLVGSTERHGGNRSTVSLVIGHKRLQPNDTERNLPILNLVSVIQFTLYAAAFVSKCYSH